MISRSYHRRCSIKKGVVENFSKFTGPEACNFIKKETPAQVVFKFIRKPFLQNTSGQLLLDIMENFIQKASLRRKRAAGKIKFDANEWWRIIASNVFGDLNLELPKSISRMEKRLCCQQLQSRKSLQPLFLYQLIQLTKPPGVRPTRIGEFLRQIMLRAVDSLKVCAGQDAVE